MKSCRIVTAAMTVALVIAAAVTIASPQQPAANDEEAALRALESQFAAAWGKSDAHAIAALFALDADLVIPTGLLMRGQSEIEAFYSSVFQEGYGGSMAGADIVRIRFLRPDFALVDATWSIKNVHDRKGAPQPDEAGVLTLIATRTPLGWRIAALREQASAKSFREFAAMAKP